VLVDVTEQMEWLDADVCAVQTALQQAPEIFQPIRLNLAIHVLLAITKISPIKSSTCRSTSGIKAEAHGSRTVPFACLLDALHRSEYGGRVVGLL